MNKSQRAAMQQALEELQYGGDSVKAADILRAALAEPVPEPVAWIERGLIEAPDALVWNRGKVGHYTPLYTSPPRREWVGLTDEEIHEAESQTTVRLANGSELWHFDQFAQILEQKLKEKNA